MEVTEALKPLSRMPIDDELRQGIIDDLKTVDAAPLSLVDKMSVGECREALKMYMVENTIGQKTLLHLSKELSDMDNTISHQAEIHASGVDLTDISRLQQLIALRHQDTRTCNLPQEILSRHLRRRLGLGKLTKKK